MKVALAYDWIDSWGGAERVLLALHAIFPTAPLYTSTYNRKKTPWASVFTIKTSWLQHIPFAKEHHEWFSLLRPIAFETFDFSAFDLVISVSSAEAKGIITKPGATHICYCLTPTRYLWSHYHDYFISIAKKIISKPLIAYLRKWDRIASSRPDYYIAISDEVKKRINRFYEREAICIYPPVNSAVKPIEKSTQILSELENKKFFLVVSRLVAYKKIEIAIEACRQAKQLLVIVGKGSRKALLQKVADDAVFFLSDLTDRELSWYYQRCCALIIPEVEDFGLVSLEAQVQGSPVIAYKGGGSLETVISGKTGEFFSPQNPQALAKIIAVFDKTRYDTNTCKQNAACFGFDRFKKALLAFIETKIHT